MGEFFPFQMVEDTLQGDLRGIVHVGAHDGEERHEYASYPVIWFEAHPEYARRLQGHLREFPRQVGYEALLSDVDGETVTFWVTDNEVASSQFEPYLELAVNTHVHVAEQVQLTTVRFDTFLVSHGLNIFDNAMDPYNYLVLDTQGSELLVLKGMGEYVQSFDAIQTEYSIEERYKGGAQLSDLDDFLTPLGYVRVFPETPINHADALYVKEQYA